MVRTLGWRPQFTLSAIISLILIFIQTIDILEGSTNINIKDSNNLNGEEFREINFQEDESEFVPEDEDEFEFWDYANIDINSTDKGKYLGSRCDSSCNPILQHVVCHPTLRRCVCEQKYSVTIGPAKGCAKPQKLGEQCFFRQTCRAYDEHSSCVQIERNAICQCDEGYHSVSHARPFKKTFCTEDMAQLTADIPTLLGVASGIALLAGLLCFVLHLYNKARFPNPHLADASLTPPMLYSLNENGLVRGSSSRASSRSSSRSGITTGGTLDSVGARRGSRARGGVPVSASRAGAARAAAILLISCQQLRARPVQCAAQDSRHQSMSSLQSGTSSVKSYSLKRFEREREQKERRQMQARLAQLHINMATNMAASLAADVTSERQQVPMPSPKSPNNSTDGLLPALSEIKEISLEDNGIINPCPGTSQQY